MHARFGDLQPSDIKASCYYGKNVIDRRHLALSYANAQPSSVGIAHVRTVASSWLLSSVVVAVCLRCRC